MNDSWERAKVEVPAQRWADLSQDDYGVSLINEAKYGYDVSRRHQELSCCALRCGPIRPPIGENTGSTTRSILIPDAGKIL